MGEISFPAIQSGDNYEATISKKDIPDDSTGFSLHLVLVNISGTFDFPSTDIGSSFKISLTPDQTKAIPQGLYTLILYFKSDVMRKKIFESAIVVYPDYSSTQETTPARKQLDLIEAEINRRLTGGDASYTASNTTITKINFKDLCDERNRLIEVVNAQNTITNKNRGKRPRKIVFGM